VCHLLLNHIGEAIIFLKKARAGNPRIWTCHLAVAAALGLGGEVVEAAAALRQAIDIRPEIVSLSDLRALPGHINPRYLSLLERTVCVGLRLAGMPDG
jgi:hypothetical protein